LPHRRLSGRSLQQPKQLQQRTNVSQDQNCRMLQGFDLCWRQETRAAVIDQSIISIKKVKGTAKGAQKRCCPIALLQKMEKTGNKGHHLRSMVGWIAGKKRKRNSKGGPRRCQSAHCSPNKKGRRQETKVMACKKRNSKGALRHGQLAHSSPEKKGEDRKQRPQLAIHGSFNQMLPKKKKKQQRGAEISDQ